MNAPLPSQNMALPDDDPRDKIPEAADALYRAECTDMWALSSNADWIVYHPHDTAHDPDAVKVLALVASGADDAELGRILRERVLANLRADCEQRAEDAANGDL